MVWTEKAMTETTPEVQMNTFKVEDPCCIILNSENVTVSVWYSFYNIFKTNKYKLFKYHYAKI
jgi:hypothetical protein